MKGFLGAALIYLAGIMAGTPNIATGADLLIGLVLTVLMVVVGDSLYRSGTIEEFLKNQEQ